MRRAALLLLLSACAGDSSRVEPVDPSLRIARDVIPPVPDLHPYSLDGVAVGQWATYREPRRTVTVAVVGREGDGLWFEEIDEGETRLVSARLVGPDGRVRRALYLEVGRGEPQAQPVIQAPPPPATGLTESARESSDGPVEAGGRTLQGRTVKVRYEDLEGRFVEEVTAWSAEVPRVYAGSEAGGLVRRRSRGETVELLRFGADARPLAAPTQ